MDRLENLTPESAETGEASTESNQQKLDDATLEPSSFVEQTRDYQQAEAIQGNFTAVVDNAAPLTQTEAVTGEMKESGGGQVGITPINLPDVVDQASSSGDVAGSGAEQVGITPINLPRVADGPAAELQNTTATAADIGIKFPGGGVEDLPIPMPTPEEIQETGYKNLGPDVEILPGSIPRPVDVIAWDGSSKNPAGEVEDLPGSLPQSTTLDARESGLTKSPGEAVEDLPAPILDLAEGGDLNKTFGTGVEMPLPTSGQAETQDFGKTVSEEIKTPLPGSPTANVLINRMVDQVRLDEPIQSEASQQQQLELQQKAEKENQRASTLSNMIKDSDDTAQDTVNNIK
jgi:hypothetical protein